MYTVCEDLNHATIIMHNNNEDCLNNNTYTILYFLVIKFPGL